MLVFPFLSLAQFTTFKESMINRLSNLINRNRLETKTRSSWLNCALRDDEAVYWVSIGHYEAVAVGN